MAPFGPDPEMQVDGRGMPTEIEYHIAPSEVPAAVQSAMRQLYPGASFTGAEHETHAGQKYWELTVTVNGHDVEAMFQKVLDTWELCEEMGINMGALHARVQPRPAHAITPQPGDVYITSWAKSGTTMSSRPASGSRTCQLVG